MIAARLRLTEQPAKANHAHDISLAFCPAFRSKSVAVVNPYSRFEVHDAVFAHKTQV
jgi:hypothetical protein